MESLETSLQKYEDKVKQFMQITSIPDQSLLINEIGVLESQLTKQCQSDQLARVKFQTLKKQYNRELLERAKAQANDLNASLNKPNFEKNRENITLQQGSLERSLEQLCNLNSEFLKDPTYFQIKNLLSHTDQILKESKKKKKGNEEEEDQQKEEEEEQVEVGGQVLVPQSKTKSKLVVMGEDEQKQRVQEEIQKRKEILKDTIEIQNIQKDKGVLVGGIDYNHQKIENKVDESINQSQITKQHLTIANQDKMEIRQTKLAAFFGAVGGFFGAVFSGKTAAAVGGAGGLVVGAGVGQAIKTNQKQ